ncbi:MAG: type II toxin-antitoxin system PemK/MazF family toxin [Bryobacteraceae bacterium]|nr:type II toxin-antitoxin system PemK/MazF family toxin [Bryobacteraceae bacterium]
MQGKDCRRGDIVLVGLDPTVGREQAKTRPCVVVRTNVASRAQVVVIVPVSDADGKEPKLPFLVQLKAGDGGLKKDSIANALQIRTVDESRLFEKWGRLSKSAVIGINNALRFALDI